MDSEFEETLQEESDTGSRASMRSSRCSTPRKLDYHDSIDPIIQNTRRRRMSGKSRTPKKTRRESEVERVKTPKLEFPSVDKRTKSDVGRVKTSKMEVHGVNPPKFNMKHIDSIVTEQTLIGKIEGLLQPDSGRLNLIKLGKHLNSGIRSGAITEENIQEFESMYIKKKINITSLFETLHSKENKEKQLTNAVVGLSFYNNLTSPTLREANSLKAELSNTIRHMERKTPPIGLTKFLDSHHTLEENQIMKATNINEWFRQYNLVPDASERQTKKVLRDMLEERSKSMLLLWPLTYRTTKPGSATSYFVPFPMETLESLEDFILDAEGIYIPCDLIDSNTIRDHPFSGLLGKNEEEQREELQRRLMMRVDNLKLIRETIAEVLQYFRANRHYSIDKNSFEACRCRGKVAGTNVIHWKDVAAGVYSIVGSELVKN